jgi:hypothetical protein
VIGALTSAWFGLPDRFDPRRVFAASAIVAGLANALLLIAPPGSMISIAARVATGALLAGVYPVGMKIAVGWGEKDRGFLVGLLIGALTLGSAAPHLMALAGGADWRITVLCASVAAIAAGFLVLGVRLGPFHVQSPSFDPRVIATAWTNRRVRLAYAGYLGHMWELYAMWAWVAVATGISYGMTMPQSDAEQWAKFTAFAAIGAGGIASVVAGLAADGVLVAITFGGAPWLTFLLVLLWGISIVPDSAQFSALVADASPPGQAGSLMTFQTALGFALTFATVQIVPALANAFGWPVVLAGLAFGPAFGIVAMLRLRSLQGSNATHRIG